MTTILSIETATPTCSVALHQDDHLLGLQEVHLEKSHSALLHVMIDHLLACCEVEKSALSGVALSMGPGSYTGLRIGASAAKGICFALDVPLIAVNTLEAMAEGVRQSNHQPAWLCPMIDARRMEVFCLLQDEAGQEQLPTQPMVIDENSFEEVLAQHEIIFFGNGSDKCRTVLGDSPQAQFLAGVTPSAQWVGALALKKFQAQQLEDVAYFTPFYAKAFRTTAPKRKKE